MLWIIIFLGLFLSVVAGIFIVTIGLSAKGGDKHEIGIDDDRLSKVYAKKPEQ
jgi:hypothetical protein